jgi:hypothetical protein
VFVLGKGPLRVEGSAVWVVLDGLAVGTVPLRCWVETAAMHAANEDYWRGRAREAEAKLGASLLHEELEHVTSRSSWVRIVADLPETRPEPVARDYLDEIASRPHLTWTDEEKREQLRALDACRCAPGTDHLPECPRLRMVVERSLHDFAQGELMVKWNRLHPGEQTRLLQAWTAELSVRDPCKDPPLSFAGFFKVKLVEGR